MEQGCCGFQSKGQLSPEEGHGERKAHPVAEVPKNVSAAQEGRQERLVFNLRSSFWTNDHVKGEYDEHDKNASCCCKAWSRAEKRSHCCSRLRSMRTNRRHALTSALPASFARQPTKHVCSLDNDLTGSSCRRSRSCAFAVLLVNTFSTTTTRRMKENKIGRNGVVEASTLSSLKQMNESVA